MASSPRREFAEGILSEFEVLESLPRAIIVRSTDGRILYWNRMAEEVYGWTAEEVIGRLAIEVLVPDSERTRASEVAREVTEGQAREGDFRVRRKDGRIAVVESAVRPIFDAEGRVVATVGSAQEVTEQRELERLAEELADRLDLALEAGNMGTWRRELSTGQAVWDARMEALAGLAPGSFGGTFEAWQSVLHPDDRADALGVIQAAIVTESRYTIRYRLVWPDGSVHWIEGRGYIQRDADGTPLRSIGFAADVTDRIESELEREQLTEAALKAADQERISRERLEFLWRINEAVSTASTRHEVMANVTAAVVPRLGDACYLSVLSDDRGPVPETVSAHFRPEEADRRAALDRIRPYDPDDPTGIPAVIRTGKLEFYPVITDAMINRYEPTAERRQGVRELNMGSAIIAPLVKADRVLGAIQFVRSRDSRSFDEDDVSLAEAVAGRIASTLENLRLAENQRSIATTLQASLLPGRLPSIPGLEIAVRYWAAGEGTEVGGDFYDVFAIDEERWALAIGDVCGTGASAAALTGLARHTLRAAAWHGDQPATALTRLNRAMLETESRSFCTAIFGIVQPIDGRVEVRFASGGHPLPLLATPGHDVQRVGAHGTLLGVFPSTRSTTSAIRLAPGDTMMLYTDGVTDVAPPWGLSDEDLATVLVDAVESSTSAERIADAMYAALSAILPFEERRDDIAILVLRGT